jgi:hypothetical protein
MTRNLLPNRRPCITLDTSWQGQPITVTVGYYPDTAQPGEVFADPILPGSRHAQIADIIRDTCTGLSVAMQHGTPPAAMAKSLGTAPVWEIQGGEMVQAEAPASPIGPILAAVMGAAE